MFHKFPLKIHQKASQNFKILSLRWAIFLAIFEFFGEAVFVSKFGPYTEKNTEKKNFKLSKETSFKLETYFK